MKTLAEHFDDLDRMVDTGASKPTIRDQIAFLWKQVASLEADYARAVDHNAETIEAKVKVENELEEMKKQKARRDTQIWQKLARDSNIEATYEPDNGPGK